MRSRGLGTGQRTLGRAQASVLHPYPNLSLRWLPRAQVLSDREAGARGSAFVLRGAPIQISVRRRNEGETYQLVAQFTMHQIDRK